MRINGQSQVSASIDHFHSHFNFKLKKYDTNLYRRFLSIIILLISGTGAMYAQAPTAQNDAFIIQNTANLAGNLFADNGSGTDNLGTPAATISSFGGGSLGGTVTTNSAGASVGFDGSTLMVNGNGTFSLLGQPHTAGTFTFNYRLQNTMGSSDATVTITICQVNAVCNNINIDLDASCMATITPAQINNGSTSNCGLGVNALSIPPTTFGLGDIGPNLVTMTVTDNEGFSATCMATVTVNPPPCPLPVNISIAINGNAVSNPNQQFCTNAGDLTLAVTATDPGGNLICLNTTGNFSGDGVTNDGNNTGTFNPAGLSTGQTLIIFSYICSGGQIVESSFPVEVIPTPTAVLEDYQKECADPSGTIFLTNLFATGSSQTGTWTYVSGPAGAPTDINGVQYAYTLPGCYSFRFTAATANGCFAGTDPPSDVAFTTITTAPSADFSLSSSGGCLSMGTESVSGNINTTDLSSFQSLTVSVNDAPAVLAAFPYQAEAPLVGATNSYEFCLTLTKTANTDCNGVTSMEDCSVTECRIVSFYNDGLDCQSNCESTTFNACEITVDPRIKLDCNLFDLSIPIDVVGAKITPTSQLIGCNDDTFTISYNSEFFMFDPNFGTDGGSTIGELDGISVICDILGFDIFGWRPLGLLYDLLGCEKTIAQAIFDLLALLLGGDGGGALVIADTDGDGGFDYTIDEGPFPLSGINVEVPVIANAQGEVHVRMVVAWPNGPTGACGAATAEGNNLLDLLPIGSIPIVGIIIEDVIAAAGCNIQLSWSNYVDVSYPVINDAMPEFVNCPTDGYTFSQDFSCDTEANWSIPVAIDGCTGEVIPFVTTDPGTEGVRKISGPDPGDDLDIGVYSVVYEATGCSGLTTQCIIPIVINAGDPMLRVPNDIVVCNDIDNCDAVIVGLGPLSGVGCNTVISWRDSIHATNVETTGQGDISGRNFPVGTTTVFYTMTYDSDGDPNTPVIDTTASFTVTVEDCQLPVAECADIIVGLNNMGALTVNAADIDGLSSDNCTAAADLVFRISDTAFGPSVSFDCSEIGINFVTLEVSDTSGNMSFCLATVEVLNYFEEFQLTLDAPELCLEANNPEQFDFTNYLNITRPNGTIINHEDLGTLGGGVTGGFGITSFIPSEGNTGIAIGTGPLLPNDIGYIDPVTGIYTPGTGTGFVTISYLLSIGDQVSQDNIVLEGCFKLVHETFELKQPLMMDDPMCQCLDVNFRVVDLPVVSGGLEPYRIEYTGATLDINSDGITDDSLGIYTFDAIEGHDITDVEQDMGQLLVNFTTPVWSITIIDARGCTISRSGSCDNADNESGPEIDCMGANDFDTEIFICERQYEWQHALPFDNCAVAQYSYTITNPDGTIEGPFNLNALIDDSDTGIPLEELFEAEYEFEVGTSTVSYYAEDAVGNFVTCEFMVTVEDNDPPYFINCPYPDVIDNTEAGQCDAFVNFALPLAEDNCEMPTVTQIDETGYSVGDRFPIGTTILVYKAEDAVGNMAICTVKVVVNDFADLPGIACPAEANAFNDIWKCSAVVDNIAPVTITGICTDLFSTTYQIEFEDSIIGTGLADVSGFIFPVGQSTVTYKVRNQPLLLISEVTQDADNLDGGMDPPPFVNDPNNIECFSNPVEPLGNGDMGEGLAIYPVEDRFFHSSGATDGNEFFEEIYLDPNIVQPNNVPGDTYGPAAATEITGLVYVDDIDNFIAMDSDGNIFTLTNTGDFTFNAAFAGANPLRGFAYDGGNVYGVDTMTNDLVQFNYTTGAVIMTYPTGVTGLTALTADLDGNAYVAYNGGMTIGTIDLTNGTITEVGETGVAMAAIAVDTTGQLYGVSSDAAAIPSTLFTIKCQAPGDDYIEITNFGEVAYDISCLVIERTLPGGEVETFIVPGGIVLAPGEVFVLHYGAGVDDLESPNILMNLCEGTDQASGEEVVYKIYYGDNDLDEITMSTEALGGIIRESLFDTDSPDDFILAVPCTPITLGEYNLIYPPAVDNGSGITTALQTIPFLTHECAFKVNVVDNEKPFCAEEIGVKEYTSEELISDAGLCNEAIIEVLYEDSCIVEFIGVEVTGIDVNQDGAFTLTSPEGTIYEFPMGYDGDSIQIDSFYREKSFGEWKLLFTPADEDAFEDNEFDFTWNLDITCLGKWVMEDTMFVNIPGFCDTVFTWTHPYFLDNCRDGTIEVEYTTEDIDPIDFAILAAESGPLDPDNNLGFGGYEETQRFPVGTTTVNYYLEDAAGNKDTCSFKVEVIDNELPTIICPPDVVLQLEGGECRVVYEYDPEVDDNCGIESVIGSIPSGSEFEIGENKVTVYVTDVNGNVDSSCMFLVTVLEYLPNSIDMSCAERVNLSLGGDCMATLTSADILLKGTEYRCFENYCMEITDAYGKVVFSGLLKEVQHIFTQADENKVFTVSIIDCLGTDDILYNEPVNSCWGTILVQEKLIPTLDCPRDTIVTCNDNTHPDSLDYAIPTSCEDDVDIYYWDDVETFEECSDNPAAVITRTWYIEDSEGNRNSCEQIITIEPGEFGKIAWPEDTDYNDALACPTSGEDVPPSVTGIPMINGKPLNESHYCNFFINYEDSEHYGACKGDFDIIRTWSVINTCLKLGDDNPMIHKQYIRIRDNQAPVVLGLPQNMRVSTDPWTCTVDLELPVPEIIKDYEYCNDIEIYASISNGTRVSQEGSIENSDLKLLTKGLNVGEYIVTYDFRDACGNKTTHRFELIVEDKVKPFAIAKEFTVASIVESDEDGNQIVKVNTESINNGSWDACSQLEYYVRRMDGDPQDCDAKDYYPEISSTATDSEKQTAIDEAFDVVECRTVDPADLIALRGGIATREHVQAKYDYGSTICNKGEIQYNGDEWGEYVKFCCDDFGAGEDADEDGYANEFRVELIVFDHYGNWNITWGWVKIEDPNPPVIAVADVTTYCHADYELLDYATLGEAKAYNACEEIPFEKDGPHWMTGTSSDPHPSNFDGYEGRSFEDFNYSCGYGYGWMKYTATNSKGISTDKFQLITVFYKDDFSCENINWPLDSITTSCLPLAPDTLTWDAGACALIGYTMETDTFDLGAEGCKKIINNYSVINWCVYDEFNAFGTDDHSTGHFDSQFNELWDHSDEAIDDQFCFDIDREEPHVTGVYKYRQVIKIIDETVPEIQECADVYVDVYDNECDFEFILRNSAIDEGCDEHNFRWLLELYDGEDLYLSLEDNGPDIDFNINYNLGGDIEKTLSAKWKVWDGCGNVDICIYDVILRDKKAPTPYLLNLSSALMEDPDPTDDVLEAMVEIWAADFDVDSKDCSDTLFFTFDNVAFGLGDEDPFEYKEVPHYFDEEGFIETYEDATQDIIDAYLAGDIYLWRPKYWPTMDNMHYTAGKVFTCSDLGEKNVIVTVWDKGLNNDFGMVRLTLRSDDCMDVTPVASVAGIINTADDRKVSNVSVNIQSLNNVVSAKSMTTSEDGAYAFSNNPMYLDYYVVARKEGDDDQGVSTLDLILIKRHILGLQMLDDPYLRIAADINYDKKITATDLVQLRKLILGIYIEFPQNESWRFVDSNQELFPETALSEYGERRNIVDLSANQMTEDLLAVKIGDINGDARVNARENSLSTRTLKSLVLSYEDHYVQKGETVNVVFAGKGQAEVYGMQFTLSLSGLKVENVEGIGFELSEANYSLSGNKIAVSINKDEKTSFDDELFEMAFVSGKSGSISELISIDGSITRNEVYVGSDLEVYTLELGKEDDVVAFDLYQNEPNPFTNFTRIGFNLGKSGEATIIIHDVTGKVIKTIVNNYKKGYNEVRLDKSELKVSGILYYTLSVGDFTTTRKMIMI